MERTWRWSIKCYEACDILYVCVTYPCGGQLLWVSLLFVPHGFQWLKLGDPSGEPTGTCTTEACCWLPISFNDGYARMSCVGTCPQRLRVGVTNSAGNGTRIICKNQYCIFTSKMSLQTSLFLFLTLCPWVNSLPARVLWTQILTYTIKTMPKQVTQKANKRSTLPNKPKVSHHRTSNCSASGLTKPSKRTFQMHCLHRWAPKNTEQNKICFFWSESVPFTLIFICSYMYVMGR